MATHATHHERADERLKLGPGANGLVMTGAILAVIGFLVALVLGHGSGEGFRRFWFAYLYAFVFFLSLALGAMFMVLMQHVTRAGWSVGVRRIAEQIIGLFPALAVLSIPIVITVVMQNGTLYRWALPLSDATPQARDAAARGDAAEETNPSENAAEHSRETTSSKLTLDATTLQKRSWLNPGFFVLRVVLYFACWCAIASIYRGYSLRQDLDGDESLTRRMQMWAGLCLVLLGLTLTGAAGDFIMSLDPHWFSTMFGVYYFAGATVSSWAVLILITFLLQRAGYLGATISREHYHDLGKYLFGFTFFWGYIAFSQYMLLWYANIPEEIGWYSRRGATTVVQNVNGWSWVIVAILFGQLLIPFAGLLSRHVKRNTGVLVFWAVWVLAFHALDNYWMVMPEYAASHGAVFHSWQIVVDLAALIGMGGLLVALLVRSMIPYSLRPERDPRLPESLAFHNI